MPTQHRPKPSPHTAQNNNRSRRRKVAPAGRHWGCRCFSSPAD
jgi:hypothetical protein